MSNSHQHKATSEPAEWPAVALPAADAVDPAVPASDAVSDGSTPPETDDATGPANIALKAWKEEHPEWRTMKNKLLPQEFWDLRRAAKNEKKSRRQQATKKRRRAEAPATGRPPDDDQPAEEHKRQHVASQRRLEEALRTGLRIVVDCCFVEECSAREMRSLATQLQLCTALNKRAAMPSCLTFTGFQGELREFCKKFGGEAWAVNRLEEATLQQFPADRVVVLSPDAEQPLEALEADKIYCIGGIVDRSPRKGITATFAAKHKVEMRRLPIAEQKLTTNDGAPLTKTNFILNVNDVFNALLMVHNGKSWPEAIDAAVPTRKRKLSQAEEKGC